MNEFQQYWITLDLGTHSSKIGLSGNDFPTKQIKYTFEELQKQKTSPKLKQKDLKFNVQHSLYLLSKPFIERGIVSDFNQFEKFTLQNVVTGSQQFNHSISVLIIQPSRNPKFNKQKMTQLMFEKINLNNFFIQSQGVLSLYSSGRITGITLTIGHGVTHTNCIFQGDILNHACIRNDFGGFDVNQELTKTLRRSQNSYLIKNSQNIHYIAQNIKQKLCFISQNPLLETQKFEKKIFQLNQYQLPDGSKIKIGKVQFEAPETLFNKTNKQIWSIDQMIWQSLQICDMDVRKDLMKNIVLSGGSSLINGLPDRLKKQLTLKAPQNIQIKIINPLERKYFPWIGGSILSSLSTFQNCKINKKQYQQVGVSIIHRKTRSQ